MSSKILQVSWRAKNIAQAQNHPLPLPSITFIIVFLRSTPDGERVHCQNASLRHQLLLIKLDQYDLSIIMVICLTLAACLSGVQNLTAQSSKSKLTSPGYPESYPNNVTCLWTIAAPTGYFVKLDFRIFDLQYKDYSAPCTSEDYVEVRDGNSSSAHLIDRYCYTEKSGKYFRDIYSTGRYLFVMFRSDSSNSGQRNSNSYGFRASYSAVKFGKFIPFTNFKVERKTIILFSLK